jgi:serine/threonine protein phosphatase PrpC
VDFDVGEQPLADGDMVLLCSDGLTNMVPDPQILELVRGAGDVATACRRLVAAANDQGGRDNISVILVHHRA